MVWFGFSDDLRSYDMAVSYWGYGYGILDISLGLLLLLLFSIYCWEFVVLSFVIVACLLAWSIWEINI